MAGATDLVETQHDDREQVEHPFHWNIDPGEVVHRLRRHLAKIRLSGKVDDREDLPSDDDAETVHRLLSKGIGREKGAFGTPPRADLRVLDHVGNHRRHEDRRADHQHHLDAIEGEDRPKKQLGAVLRKEIEHTQQIGHRRHDHGDGSDRDRSDLLAEHSGREGREHECEERREEIWELQIADLFGCEFPHVAGEVDRQRGRHARGDRREERRDKKNQEGSIAQRFAELAGNPARIERPFHGRRLLQIGDVSMRTDRGRHDRGEHDDRSGKPVVRPALDIKQTALLFRQEHEIGKHRHDQAAPPGKEVAEAHELGALVIVLGEFSDERRRGNVVEGHRRANQDCHYRQIDDKRILREVRRRPEEVIPDAHRHRGQIHERMPSPPARSEIVRKVAYGRIRYRVEKQCDEQREGHRTRRQADDLAVEEQQQIGETIRLRALRDGAEAIDDLGAEVSGAVRFRFHGAHHGVPALPCPAIADLDANLSSWSV